jgi:hypothetical protein
VTQQISDLENRRKSGHIIHDEFCLSYFLFLIFGGWGEGRLEIPDTAEFEARQYNFFNQNFLKFL